MRARRRHAAALMKGAALGAGIAILDIASKAWAEGQLDEAIEVLPGVQLQLGHNSGVAFGALNGLPTALLIAIGTSVIVLLMFVAVTGVLVVPWQGLALLLGGATANLIDRLGDGRVTDFVDILSWPPFNLADAAITLGILLVIVRGIRDERSVSPARAPSS